MDPPATPGGLVYRSRRGGAVAVVARVAATGAASGGGSGAGFDPPYVLGGRMALLAGFLSPGPLPALARATGFEPVRALGRPLAVVVVSRYDRPPAAQPIVYDEVIVALLVRRRRSLRLGVVPLAMRLNQRVPVDEGRVHYSLPKEYDPTLRLAMEEGVRAVGQDLDVQAAPLAPGWGLVAALPSSAFALGARVFTAAVPVYGVAGAPWRRAIIAIRPATAGAPLRVLSARVPGVRFQALWAQDLGRCETWLGPPRDLPSPGAPPA